MEYYVFTAGVEGKQQYCISVLPQNKAGMPQAIAGYLKSAQVDLAEFEENPVFKAFLHAFLAKHLPTEPDFLKEGQKVGNGYVYLVDKRTKNPKGDVPMPDIIGAINFENGNVQPDSYLPNKNYKLLTAKGFMGLPVALEEALLKELQQP
ncbi:hypothetical protein Q0590_29400 [Rhodocytophaga aerolata]|uniref:Uncharacterized protein n=1 Tax=Rhodocytophaga aerolata TaxID=455078 RepID=A0ABT8REA4_9BACT|nr:hypothetical protein [Rhodocytophaga aerolata]MDO1450427.1 hypothetical protein [Rhodocytophaga aerolata]